MTIALPMIALLAALILGFWKSGFLIAGAILTFQAESVIGNGYVSPVYLVCALAVLLMRRPGRPQAIVIGKVDVGLLVLLLAFLVTSMIGVDPTRSLIGIAQLAAVVFITYLLGRFEPNNAIRKAREACYGLTFLAPPVMVAMLATRNTDTYTGMTRLIVGQGTAVGLAQPIPFVILAGVFVVIFGKPLIARVIGAASLSLAIYIIIISSTRGAILGAVLGIIVLLVSTFKLKYVPSLALYACLFFIGGAFVLSTIEPELITQFLDRTTINFGESGVRASDQSTNERLIMISLSQELFRANPVSGIGYNNFGLYSFYDYPHNMILEIAVSAGAIGLFGLAIFLLSLFADTRHFKRISGETGGLVLAMIAIVLAQSMVSYSFVMLKPLFIFSGLAAAGAVAGAGRKRRSQSSQLGHLDPRQSRHVARGSLRRVKKVRAERQT